MPRAVWLRRRVISRLSYEIDQLLSPWRESCRNSVSHSSLVEEQRRAGEAIRESEQQLRKARDELETKVAERTRRAAAQRNLFG